MAHHICPKCNRPLTKPNAWHYCKRISIDSLFEGKPPDVLLTFDALLAEVGSWPGVSASATKSCVVFVAAKTFLVVKVMKSELDLKFVLPGEQDDFPIYKRAAYGNKLEHYIRLAAPDDVDSDVFRLIRQAYTLVQHTTGAA